MVENCPYRWSVQCWFLCTYGKFKDAITHGMHIKYIKYQKKKFLLLLVVMKIWMSIPAWLSHRFSSEQKWCLHDQKARVVEKLGCHAVSQSRPTAFSLWFLLENLFSMEEFSRKFEYSFFFIFALLNPRRYTTLFCFTANERTGRWWFSLTVMGDNVAGCLQRYRFIATIPAL